MQRTANAYLQREMNISAVFNCIRTHSPTFRAEIARSLTLSAPGVSRAVDDLVEAGFVVERGAVRTKSGKRAGRVEVNAEHAKVIAVDLLKGELKLGQFDFAGEGRVRHTGVDLSGADNLANALVREIERTGVRGAGPTTEGPRLLIGLGVPAAVDGATGRILGASISPQLEHVDIKGILEQRFGATVYVENDVKLAALAEHRYGHGRGHRSMVYVDVSNGIGVGIVIDGQIVRGASGFAGEIGYAQTSATTMRHDVATGNTLEKTASLGAIAGEAQLAARRGVDSKLVPDRRPGAHAVTAADVFSAAADGDRLSAELISRAVDRFTVSLMHAMLLLDPNIVVIGGDLYEMPHAKRLFLDPLQESLTSALPFSPPPLIFSALGADACVRGAARLALDQYSTSHFPFRVQSAVVS